MKYVIFVSMVTVLTLGTIGNAFYRHSQYYPAIVYLSRSNASLTVGYLVAAYLLWALGYSALVLLFGELRRNESEEIWERLKYVATETLMAFAIFRDDFSPYFALMFTVLLYMKVIHWLGEERVDYLERSPVLPKLFHARILSLLVILGVFDFSFLMFACKKIHTAGPSPFIAFGFEYFIMIPSVFFIFLKYILHTIEIRREVPLEDKAIILLYGQIISDFVRIVLYFSYLAVMFRLYLLPAFAFRQIFNTMRNFTTAVNDVLAFRKAVRYMKKFCPNATKEELAMVDTLCIVCREDMHFGAKKLPCNHIFHCNCLRSWFQRQQTCPTCRLKILDTIIKGSHDLEVVRQARRNSRRVSEELPISPNQSKTLNSVAASSRSSSSSQVTAVNQNIATVTEKENISTFHGPQTEKLNSSSKFQHAQLQNSPTSSFSIDQNGVLTNITNQNMPVVESSTRANIENRIKCLQNMSKMLESTIAMIDNYYQATDHPSRNRNNPNTDQGQEENTCADESADTTATAHRSKNNEMEEQNSS